MHITSTSSRPPPDSMVPVLFLRLLFEYLNERGLDAVDFLGMPEPDASLEPLAGYPAKSFCDLLIDVSARLGEPLLGIHLGARIRLDHLGALGEAFASCGSVAEAMLRLMRYKDLLHATHDMEVRPDGENIVFEWPVNSWYFGRVFDELGLAAITQVTRELTKAQHIISRIEFVNSKPPVLKPYRDYFGGEILFDRPATKLYVAANILSRPLLSPDRKRAAQLDRQIESWLKNASDKDGLENETRRAIVQLTREGMPDLERVANTLELSPRQFARQLTALGLNFRSLREQTLRSLAEAYMQSAELSLTDIAQLLGYAEQSVLSRAVQRWTGMSARQWRKQLMSEQACSPDDKG